MVVRAYRLYQFYFLSTLFFCRKRSQATTSLEFLLDGRAARRALLSEMAHLFMTLRAVNHRLTNLPVQQLPAIAASLAASITECGELLSTPQSQKAGKADSDHAVQVHKLVTRISSLLQDRSFEGRWAAVVLVKALVEAGQWEILRGSEPFVRGLMGILSVSILTHEFDLGFDC